MPLTKIKSKWESDGSLSFSDGTNELAKFDATTGKLVAASGVTGNVTGNVTGAVLTSGGDGVVYATAPLTRVAAATAQATAIVVPAGSVIEAVYIDVATQEATGANKTVDIGISGGDEDGFLDGVSVAAAGTIKGTLVNTGQTLGSLLSVDESGAGVLVPEPYVCAAATTICYTLKSNDFAELVGRVVVKYSKIG